MSSTRELIQDLAENERAARQVTFEEIQQVSHASERVESLRE